MTLSAGRMWSPWVCCITLLFFLEGNNCGDVVEVVAGRRSVELDDATRAILQFNGYADFQPIVTEEKKATDKTPLKRKNPDIKYSVIEDIQDDDEDMDMEYGDVQDAQEDDVLTRLRTKEEIKTDRSSTKNISKKVKPLPHQPFKDDPQGCGNPICVVLDQKPRRFPSLCQFRKWLLETSRDCQINFIQKGDCYEIIDGNGKKKMRSNHGLNPCQMITITTYVRDVVMTLIAGAKSLLILTYKVSWRVNLVLKVVQLTRKMMMRKKGPDWLEFLWSSIIFVRR